MYRWASQAGSRGRRGNGRCLRTRLQAWVVEPQLALTWVSTGEGGLRLCLSLSPVPVPR